MYLMGKLAGTRSRKGGKRECAGEDLNLHALRHMALNYGRLCAVFGFRVGVRGGVCDHADH